MNYIVAGSPILFVLFAQGEEIPFFSEIYAFFKSFLSKDVDKSTFMVYNGKASRS